MTFSKDPKVAFLKVPSKDDLLKIRLFKILFFRIYLNSFDLNHFVKKKKDLYLAIQKFLKLLIK